MAVSGNWQSSTINGMQYLTLLPDDYTPGVAYPLLVFLHGGNQAGLLPGLTDPWFNTPAFRAAYPAIVVEPVLPANAPAGYWGGYGYGGLTTYDSNTQAENNVLALTQQILTQYGADPNRVYLTGLSAGGYGTWDLLIKDNAYDGTQGRVFAAGLTLTGGEQGSSYLNAPNVPTQAVANELSGVPIWAINTSSFGAWDRALVGLLPSNSYHYTEFGIIGEDTWDPSYPLPNGKPYYDWLFSQSAKLPAAQTATAAAAVTMPTASASSPGQLGTEQEVARLYIAAFGRDADSGGLVVSYRGLSAGLSLAQLGDSFLTSPEFTQRYGTPSESGFVTSLYQNVLGRPGDPTGIQGFETDLLNGLTRGGALAAFANSPEAIALAQASSGTVYAATAEQQVARLYDTAFARAPDAGSTQLSAAILNGLTLPQAAASLMNSAEFSLDYGAMPSDTSFVNLLYGNVLHRTPDASGQAYYLQALQAGRLSRMDVFVGFSESQEHIALLATANS